MSTMILRAGSVNCLRPALDQCQRHLQGFFILGSGGQRLGQLQLQFQVVRIGGRSSAATFRTAGLLAGDVQFELRFEPLRFGFEKAACFELIDERACFVDSILRKQHPGQPDRCRRQFGARLAASRNLTSAAAGSLASSLACGGHEQFGRRRDQAIEPVADLRLRAADRRTCRPVRRRAKRRRPESIARRIARPPAALARFRPSPAGICRHIRRPAFPAWAPASGMAGTTRPKNRRRPAARASGRSHRPETSRAWLQESRASQMACRAGGRRERMKAEG